MLIFTDNWNHRYLSQLKNLIFQSTLYQHLHGNLMVVLELVVDKLAEEQTKTRTSGMSTEYKEFYVTPGTWHFSKVG